MNEPRDAEQAKIDDLEFRVAALEIRLQGIIQTNCLLTPKVELVDGPDASALA